MGVIKMSYIKPGFFIFLFFAAVMNLRGQALKEKDTTNVQFINSRKFYIYKVEKGETLFSISQKFKIPQEEIIQFNKDIEKNGLKAKMKVWVPAYSWLKKDTVAEEKKPEEKIFEAIYDIGVIT